MPSTESIPINLKEVKEAPGKPARKRLFSGVLKQYFFLLVIVTIIAARINTAIRYTLAILADTKKAAVIANMSENGEVDMEASRRVEFLFRLKDEEMIREMIEILSAE